MITIRKLRSLPEKLLVKKCAYLMHEFRLQLQSQEVIDRVYLRALLNLDVLLAAVGPEAQRALSAAEILSRDGSDSQSLVFMLDDVYYALLKEIGSSPADWDFRNRGSLDASKRRVHPFTVYLDRVRSPFNVGSLFRTSDSFGVEQIILGEGTASPEHPRAKRTARGCEESVKWLWGESTTLRSLSSEPIFALELGGTPIEDFPFPARGTVIIGSEELGISPEMAEAAKASLGYVSIPLAGTKGSLNVSVAFGILMQHWFQAVT
jgi:TrmH family RNA methyltransferase